MSEQNLSKSVAEIFTNSFVIPYYQRNFAWRRNEIEQLLTDVAEAYRTGVSEYHIGSLVTIQRHDGRLEVIDGQQRLTALSLIARVLCESTNAPTPTVNLAYDARPEMAEFLAKFNGKPESVAHLDAPAVYYLREAVATIRNARIRLGSDGHETLTRDAGAEFRDYFLRQVRLVLNELPDDTDVASYFEIMNNRGEQLKNHEILKSRMMAKLTSSAARARFAEIWDACSQMNVRIQRAFTKSRRSKLFGDDYRAFRAENIFAGGEAENQDMPSRNERTLSEILLDTVKATEGSAGDTSHPDEDDDCEENGKAIIDFPNFLMHVFKLILPEERNIALNETGLLTVDLDDWTEQDVKAFISKLLYCRTVFDRFVPVTRAEDEGDETDGAWEKALQRPGKDTKGSLVLCNTFDGDQEQVLKLLTMLHVSFPQRIYKQWLFDVLKMFDGRESTFQNLTAGEYVTYLEKWCADYYTKTINPETDFNKGVATPHFLLNYIDYLYWKDSISGNPVSEGAKFVGRFDFRIRNSVEHHLPQSYGVANVDSIGNLYLISQNANSRLSDRDPKEKVNRFGVENKRLPPNRAIIYRMTKDGENGQQWQWTSKMIDDHKADIEKLLNHFLHPGETTE